MDFAKQRDDVKGSLLADSQPADSLPNGAVELSNTNVGRNLLDLSDASTLFKSSVRVLDASESMFDSLLTLGRQ